MNANVKDGLEILSGLLTPVIALTTVFIAFQQKRLERYKWRLAIYDKRYETYRTVTEFLSMMCLSGN